MEPIAYELGFHPWDSHDRFWRMTPRDLEDEYIGYLARLDRLWEQTAFQTSYLIAVNSKKGKAPKRERLLPHWPFSEHVRKCRG